MGGSKELRRIKLYFLILVVFVFSPIRICYGDIVSEDQSVSIETDDENYSFTLIREISTTTGQYVHTDTIPFSYSILCIDSLDRTIETYEGSGEISSGKDVTVIDVQEIADEMKDNYLAKSYEIKIEMNVTKIDNAVCNSMGRITLSIEDIIMPGSQEYFDYLESIITGGQTNQGDYEDSDEEYPDEEYSNNEYLEDEYLEDEYLEDENPEDEYPEDEVLSDEYTDDEYLENNSGISKEIAETVNQHISGGQDKFSTVKTVLYIVGAAIISGAVITAIIVLRKKKS